MIQAVLLLFGSKSIGGELLRGGNGVLSVVASENDENQWMGLIKLWLSTGQPVGFL